MARALAIAGRGEKAAIQEVTTQPPGDGQVLVAVEAATVNGIDAATAAGYLWDMLPHTFPVILGRDFAGRIEAVGGGVTEFEVGDRVAGVINGMTLGNGSIAATVTVDADSVAVIPDGLPTVEAAGVALVGVTAASLIDALQLTADDVLLVSGATGGVGAIAVQLALASGATVIGTARPDATSFVSELGAHEVVDYTVDLAAAVKAVAPEGVTAIVHAAGDPATLAAVLRTNGRLASAVAATSEQAGRDDITVLPVMADATREKLTQLLEATASGRLQVPISSNYSFEDSAAALAAFADHKRGKLVITHA